MRILITDDVHPDLITGFENWGWTVDFCSNINYEECKSVIYKYDGLVINSKINCNKEFIDLAKNMRFIARLGSGMEIVDIPYAETKGIKVISSPEGNCDAVAEHVMGMILCLLNNILRADNEVRQKTWNREGNRGTELRHKTVGIIGYGHTGQALVKKLRGFECRILVHDKYKQGFDNPQNNVYAVSLRDIQDTSDIISFHLPLTAETKGYADKLFWEKCKKSPIAINTSRGQILRIEDAIHALEKGLISGLGMDVFENEKPSTYTDHEKKLYERLFSESNTIFTPHIAGWTRESKISLSRIILQKLNEWRLETE